MGLLESDLNGGGMLVALLSCFRSGGTGSSGETCMVLCWPEGGAVQSVYGITLLRQSVLVSEGQGRLQPHPCILEFSQWRLVLE